MLDTLNQTGPQLPLPDDLQSRIENAQNNITIMEAEFKRLTKLSQDLTNDINAKHIVIKDLEESIDSLKIVDSTLNKAIQEKVNQNGFLGNDIDIKKSELAQIQEETKQLKEINEIAIAGINERETKLEEKEKEIAQRIADLLKKETAHSQKVERLLKAIE